MSTGAHIENCVIVVCVSLLIYFWSGWAVLGLGLINYLKGR